ncbi:hypothetical protein KHA94_00265 [Bacillus sp. FJAT-49705]|uniref:Uncharacterized protein n=1 Tax=Cytobacillus citreus TaxID=2833586 RepID=A0ABS5NLG0_9BACI|nr:hypothetical protein [Cytobacillus citreus]MBS4188653.1 hypothetical protein [Cytobacillus citreus]
MRITLLMGEEEKTFSVPRVKGRILRTAVALNKKLSKKDTLDEETVDDLVQFVCEVFNNQFSIDDVLDGLPLEGFTFRLQEILIEVISKATSGIKIDENGAPYPKN